MRQRRGDDHRYQYVLHTSSPHLSIGFTQASAGAASFAQRFTAFIGFTRASFPGRSDFEKDFLAIPVHRIRQVFALCGILSVLGGFCHGCHGASRRSRLPTKLCYGGQSSM
jgi:hypothetical protein